MKCSSRLLCGLLISCLVFRGSSEDLSVIQSPSNITVSEGDSAEISCCWNITKAKVAWYINETKQDTKLEIQAPQKQNCSTLHLTNIIKNDAGHYVCEVTQDIPVLKKKNGTGTNLYVSDRQLDETTTDYAHTVFNTSGTVIQGTSRSWDVIIFIFRSLPLICLLSVFIYINRGDKPITRSKPALSGDSGGADEDLEDRETQTKDTEEVKQDESVCEEEEGRVKPEKPDTAAATEEEETESLVNTERVTFTINEHENETSSAPNTEENTHLIEDVDEQSVSVLECIITAL